MTKLATYLSELGPLLQQLEAASDTNLSAGQWFEWRIRARLIEERLYTVTKPPGGAKSGEEAEILPVPPAFDEDTIETARHAVPASAALREALKSKRLKVALGAAREVARVVLEL